MKSTGHLTPESEEDDVFTSSPKRPPFDASKTGNNHPYFPFSMIYGSEAVARAWAENPKPPKEEFDYFPDSMHSNEPPKSLPASNSKKPTEPKPANEMEKEKPKGRVSHTYVLPSGEIVTSGKGLGRGRPGIKRGPQTPRISDLSTSTKPTTRKRKQSDEDLEKGSARKGTSGSSTDSESEDEYTPQPTQTRSGRNTQRPPAFVPESPSHKKFRPMNIAPTAPNKTVVKPKSYKDKNALCEHCSRGYGPPKNPIVFCDACNRCWHQKCHDPPISRKVIVDTRSEWFCRGCTEVMCKGEKVDSKKTVEAPRPAVRETQQVPKDSSQTTIPSSKIAQLAQRAYYSTLDKDALIDLVLQASAMAPDLAIWPRFAPPTPPVAASTNTTPVTTTTITQDAAKSSSPNGPTKEADVADDEDEDLFDEHARLYPRPGNGVQLPAENEDLHMLLEGPRCSTFSHRVGGVLQRVGVLG